MSPESLLEQFGYFAVFVGTFLEGEAILVAAGFFASRGYLDVVARRRGRVRRRLRRAICSGSGSAASTACGCSIASRSMKRHFGKSVRVFERYGPAAIIITQWIYGLRITCAVIIGMSRISLLKFLIYEAVSCAVWAVVITAARLLLRPRHRDRPRPRGAHREVRPDHHRGHRRRLLAVSPVERAARRGGVRELTAAQLCSRASCVSFRPQPWMLMRSTVVPSAQTMTR